MDLGAFGFWMFLGGGLLAIVINYLTENEYPLVYWLSWGLMIGGLLAWVAVLQPVRSSYLFWSTLLGLILMGLFLAGKSDDEWLPGAWCGVGIVAVNLLLLVGLALPAPAIALICGIFALGLLVLGNELRQRPGVFYDAAYSAAAILAIVAGLFGARAIRTPLEQINLVALPELSSAYQAAQSRVRNFPARLTQAQQIRAQIDQEFDDAASLEIVDRYIQTATERNSQAQTLLQQVGVPQSSTTVYRPGIETEIGVRTEQARTAVSESQAAFDQLDGVQQAFEDLSQEWIREYLWFEVDGYWTSEDSESPAYNVCYYGERLSTRSQDNTQEQIVSDGESSDLFGSDQQGRDWKYFTVDDYNELVNSGIVPAASSGISSPEDVGYYLCGNSPQMGEYGALGEPTVVIEKEYGSLRRELGDEAASFVGNYRYGTWCVPNAGGGVTPLDEEQAPPADAQWCWYQKPGDSTNYYWERRGQSGSWIWIRSHRRCVYCTPQARWGGGELVADREMARANGTDGTTVRGPLDQGGGPGTGK